MAPSRKSTYHKTSPKVVAGRGAFLRDLKKLEQRYGQKNLAKMIGVAPRSLRRYKQGTRVPRYDVVGKIKRAARIGKKVRRTKSIKLRKTRATAVMLIHPELAYFEKREAFKYSDTDHVILYDVGTEDIESLIGYLTEQGCGAAFFVISGQPEKGKRKFYSSEVMEISDFSESWEDILSALRSQYDLRKMTTSRIDLIGIKYNAPSIIERS